MHSGESHGGITMSQWLSCSVHYPSAVSVPRATQRDLVTHLINTCIHTQRTTVQYTLVYSTCCHVDGSHLCAEAACQVEQTAAQLYFSLISNRTT